ncbi:MAG: S8 family serine peptidase, partial [Gaiellaceae bacterium]
MILARNRQGTRASGTPSSIGGPTSCLGTPASPLDPGCLADGRNRRAQCSPCTRRRPEPAGGSGGAGSDRPRNTATVRYAPGRLIVGLEEGASNAKVTRLVARAGAKVKRSLARIDARVLEVPDARIEDAIASLQESSTVEYVEREVLLERTETVPNDALWTGQW